LLNHNLHLDFDIGHALSCSHALAFGNLNCLPFIFTQSIDQTNHVISHFINQLIKGVNAAAADLYLLSSN